MCGLNGIYAYRSHAPRPTECELLATRDQMFARGPDGAGVWWNNDLSIGLGHRRLAIVDLSERAKQPMCSIDRSRVIVFNGEIYNLPELRGDLEAEGYEFRTNSDTEALLHLYDLLGEAMLGRLRGMFAFAIWDDASQSLFLARDPFGIKPLYYADDGSTFRFASQVKALVAGGCDFGEIDPAGVVGFHLWGSVPEPFTLHSQIKALPAGHMLRIKANDTPIGPHPYVSLADEIARGAAGPVVESELAFFIQSAAKNSVAAHLLADVDVGVFLSAGIDSGALLGLMTDAGAKKVHAITLGFDSFAGTKDDEVPLATDVATHYHARHTVRRISQAEFKADLPAILAAMDQPSIDGVNTWFVAKAAREAGLKVALSGLGGDEILGGYPGFSQIPLMARAIGRLNATPFAADTARRLIKLLGLHRRRPKITDLMEYGGTLEGAYLLRRGLFLPKDLPAYLDANFVAEGLARLGVLGQLRSSIVPDPGSNVGRIAALEYGAYTRNQLLRDADWAGMAHSVEIRTPLLDIAFLRQVAPVIPLIRGKVGKQALGQSPSRPLPGVIIRRNKSGFTVPTSKWMADAAEEPQMQKSVDSKVTKGIASRGWARLVFEESAACTAKTSLERRRGSKF